MAATLVAQAVRKLWFYPRVRIGKAVHKASYCNIKPTGHMRPRAPKSGYLKSQSSVATTTLPLSLAAASPSATLQAPLHDAVDIAERPTASAAPSTKHPPST